MYEKITEGGYRNVYEYDENYILKKTKKYREKKYFFGLITIKYNQKIYTLLKFGISDFNKYEIQIINKVKSIIPKNIPKETLLIKEGLKQSKIKDFDGKLSKNIKNFNGILPGYFIEELKNIIKLLLEKNIQPTDILANIIIQEYEKNKFKPILFDFKRVGGRTYIFQPWLLISKKQREKKVLRKIKRI